ncbi:hypothetical protein D3C80_1058990 [compost metagenome]
MPCAVIGLSFAKRRAGVTEQLVDRRQRSGVALIFKVTDRNASDGNARLNQRIHAVAQALLLRVEIS